MYLFRSLLNLKLKEILRSEYYFHSNKCFFIRLWCSTTTLEYLRNKAMCEMLVYCCSGEAWRRLLLGHSLSSVGDRFTLRLPHPQAVRSVYLHTTPQTEQAGRGMSTPSVARPPSPSLHALRPGTLV